MPNRYEVLGLFSLEPGSWADWFSGTMSALAVVTALAGFPIARWQKAKDDKRRDVEVGRSVGWKLLKVLNATGDIDRHLKGSLSRKPLAEGPGYKFQLVQPLGVPDRPLRELNQIETDLLLKMNSADLLAEIDMAVDRYGSIVFAMNEYRNRHQSLYELMPPPVAREGTVFTHRLSPEEASRIGPYADMLEALLDGMVSLTDENMKRLRDAMTLYGKEMTRHFGKALVTFEDVSSTPES